MFLKIFPDTEVFSSFLNVEQLCREFIRTQIVNKINEKY